MRNFSMCGINSMTMWITFLLVTCEFQNLPMMRIESMQIMGKCLRTRLLSCHYV